jgi:hypothetical protein
MKVSRHTDPATCITIADRLAYSAMIRDWTLEIANDWSAPPDASGAVPLPNPAMPWTSGEWGQYYLDAENANERVLKRENKRQKNRALYAKLPKE